MGYTMYCAHEGTTLVILYFVCLFVCKLDSLKYICSLTRYYSVSLSLPFCLAVFCLSLFCLSSLLSFFLLFFFFFPFFCVVVGGAL